MWLIFPWNNIFLSFLWKVSPEVDTNKNFILLQTVPFHTFVTSHLISPSLQCSKLNFCFHPANCVVVHHLNIKSFSAKLIIPWQRYRCIHSENYGESFNQFCHTSLERGSLLNSSPNIIKTWKGFQNPGKSSMNFNTWGIWKKYFLKT